MDVKLLEGEILTHIDIDDSQRQIMLTTESGRIFKIFHAQDCCEDVLIKSTEGDWNTLKGKVIESVSLNEKEIPDDFYRTATETEITFVVNDSTVISRWIGTSNGYYSESVDFEEVINNNERNWGC